MVTIRKILDLLTPRERRQAFLMVPLVVLMALAEVSGIASIAPFLSLVSDPEAARSNAFLAWAYGAFGFQNDRAFLIAVGMAVIVILIASNALLAAGYWVLFRFGSIRNYSISRRLLIRYLQQPYQFFLTRNSAELANNILQEVTQIIHGTVVPGLVLIAKTFASLAIVILLVLVDPVLATMVSVLLGGAYTLLFTASRRYLARIGKARVRANQRRYQSANEAMGGIKDLQLLGRESEMVRRFSEPSLRFAIFQANSRIIGVIPRYLLEAIAFGSVVAIVLVLLGADRTVSEVVPVIGLYGFAGYRLMPALQAVFSSATQIRYSSGALDEVHDILKTVPGGAEAADTFDDRAAIEPLPFASSLRFEDVSFRYPGSGPVLQGIDLEIPARASVAFVGSTGAGKTTLVDLLLGLLRPTGGRLVVDGVVLDEDNRPSWQKQIGYVPQSIFLTDDTITRNIAFGLPDEAIDIDAVRRAARMAQVDRFIEEELPDGYETVVGERGVRLSGGQRQRLAIARALYHDPEVLVLDEATSALDGSTERHVFEAIQPLAGAKTMVLIAHRLATIRACDAIYVLEHGRIVASGTYDELLASSPEFRELASAAESEAARPGSSRSV